MPVNEGVLNLKPWLVAPGQQQLPGLAAYEIMAFMAKANARPIGTKVVDFFVRNNGTNININDLGLPARYADQWSAHSFQFHFDAATTSQFWRRVVDTPVSRRLDLGELQARHLLAMGGGALAALGMTLTAIKHSTLAFALTLTGLALVAVGLHKELGKLIS